MPKLYAILEGLVAVAASPGGNPMVLLVQTYPDDKDGMGQPLPPHKPRVVFRSGGKLVTRQLKGEDVSFITGTPAAPVVSQLERLPSFAEILSYAPGANGQSNAQLAQVNPGCVGAKPGTACLVTGKPKPRLAGRVTVDQGTLTSIQVDDNGNAIHAAPTTFSFNFLNDTKAPALEMACDNALLLKMDTNGSGVKLKVGAETYPLDKALQTEKNRDQAALDDPVADCVIVHITDMVDPMLMAQMKMDQMADAHFPIFFDLLPGYTGPRVMPSVILDGQGDPPLSRCIPPKG